MSWKIRATEAAARIWDLTGLRRTLRSFSQCQNERHQHTDADQCQEYDQDPEHDCTAREWFLPRFRSDVGSAEASYSACAASTRLPPLFPLIGLTLLRLTGHTPDVHDPLEGGEISQDRQQPDGPERMLKDEEDGE